MLSSHHHMAGEFIKNLSKAFRHCQPICPVHVPVFIAACLFFIGQDPRENALSKILDKAKKNSFFLFIFLEKNLE